MVQEGKLVVENLNYAGVVTRMLQPILPIFFAVQFAFLYDGWQNRFSLKQVQVRRAPRCRCGGAAARSVARSARVAPRRCSEAQHEALAEQMKTAQSRHAELAEPTELARSRREALAEPTSLSLEQ